jgi:hypothetical protein
MRMLDVQPEKRVNDVISDPFWGMLHSRVETLRAKLVAISKLNSIKIIEKLRGDFPIGNLNGVTVIARGISEG